MNNHQLPYWLALSQISALGPITWQRLIDYFETMEDAWRADIGELITSGIEPKIATTIIDQRKTIDPEKCLADIQKADCNVVTILDNAYPRLLKETYAPPALLYYIGSLPTEGDTCIGVVGNRANSGYGQRVTHDIASQLASAGVTVVSGLALGVDAIAHAAAVEANAPTVAVLGSGINMIYPRTNYTLAEKIIATGGCVLSEFCLGTEPYKSNFPRRNRLIAGLSKAVIVTEAGEKSGSLITAKFALEANREVMAVPHSIYNVGSMGPHQLLRDGAHLVTCGNDVLLALNIESVETIKEITAVAPTSANENILLSLLTVEPLHIDKLAIASRLDISIVSGALALLELKGRVIHLGNQCYAKKE
jgi:DNA processing protein